MGIVKNVGCGCLVGIVVLFGLVALLLMMSVCFCMGKISATDGLIVDEYGTERPETEKPFEQKWMCGDGAESDPKIVYIPIRGVIEANESSSNWLCGELSPYKFALRSIRAASRDERVKGLYLFLDTPGGTVTDSDVLADAIARFRAAGEGRFVFAQMGALCCSGGYYIAAGADHIMAYPTTLTGSIGVIMNGLNAAELAKKVGVKSVTIASGANKALLDPLAPVDPEHVKIMKRPVEQDHARFVSIVAKGRKLSVEKVCQLADGRVLSAQDAKEAKLVDSIGYDEDAWEKLAEMARAKKIRIYRYKEHFSWMNIFSSSTFMEIGQSFVSGMRSGVENAPRNEYRFH